MKLAIVGSRSFNNYKLFDQTMTNWFLAKEQCFNSTFDFADFHIISGGAVGADTLAKQWARQHLYDVRYYIEILPDYKKYPPKVAPIMRNKLIVEQADEIIAFYDMSSKGTLDVIKKALTLNKPIIVIPFKE